MGVWGVVGLLVAIVAIMGLVLVFATRAQRRDGGATGVESGTSTGGGGDRPSGSHDGGADGGGGNGGGGNGG